MKKSLLLVVCLLAVGLLSGCASGFRYTQKSTCPSAVVENNGKLSGGYSSSEYSLFGIGQGVENGKTINGFALAGSADPYSGAPVYVVNGGSDIYGGRGRTGHFSRGYLGENGHRAGRYANMAGADYNGFGNSGPMRRGAYARQAMMDYNSGAQNYSANNYNPYPGNTPTRGPRDFLAPNPPSIGP